MSKTPKKTASLFKKKPVPKTRWLCENPVDTPFLYAHALRCLENLLLRHRNRFEDSDIFKPVASLMHHDKLMEIFNALTTVNIRDDLRRSVYHCILEPQREKDEDLLDALWLHPKTRASLRRRLRPWISFARQSLEKKLRDSNDSMLPRFNELQRLFSLNDIEMDILIAVVSVADNVWPAQDLNQMRRNRRGAAIWAALLGVPLFTYLSYTHEESKLRRYHCLDADGELCGNLLPYIMGIDDKPITSQFFKKSEETPLPWAYFGELAERHGKIIRRLVTPRPSGPGIHVLFYGEPGTGKTSFALTLAAETGLTPYMIAQSGTAERMTKGPDFRLAAVQVCDGQLDPAKSIIVVDEADEMLGGGCGSDFARWVGGRSRDRKGEINAILDTVRTPCIWITNTSHDELDISNRRRFDYSIRFDKLNRAQRKTIWQNAAQKYAVANSLPDTLTDRLADRYEVSAGGINLAVKNLAGLMQDGATSTESVEQSIACILEPHCELMEINRGKRKFQVCRDYSLEGLRLKTPIPLERIEKAMHCFLKEQKEATSAGIDRPRMNLLLSGPPGTGKSEFVKHLGHTLDHPIMVKMGSDLISMWVGGTEKNISNAFREASSQRAVLFMDEFDGLMQSRGKAQRSWEITQVNELLQQMENFDGIFIAATNFSENLDAAAIRRFTFKVDFDYLDTDGKMLFFERFFKRALDDGQRTCLAAISNLAPGDFHTVRQSLFYQGEDNSVEDILGALQAESRAKMQGRGIAGRLGF